MTNLSEKIVRFLGSYEKIGLTSLSINLLCLPRVILSTLLKSRQLGAFNKISLFKCHAYFVFCHNIVRFELLPHSNELVMAG